MDKGTIQKLLINNKAELHKRGLLHVSLFGAYARGEEDGIVPVDLLVTLRPESHVDLIDLVETEDYLTTLVHHKVQLTTAPITKKDSKEEIERESIHVF